MRRREQQKNAQLEAKIARIAAEKRAEYSRVARERAIKEKEMKEKIKEAEQPVKKPSGFFGWLFGY